MKRRVLSALLVLTLLAALCLSAGAAKAAYDPDAAIRFAKHHWNDGIGECAEFVSRCLQAGGVSCYSMRCSELAAQLRATGLFTEYDLPVNSDMTVSVPDDPKALTQGDVVFFFCTAQNDYLHATLFDSADANGRMRVYAHNNANNASGRYIYCARCPECGRTGVIIAKVMHFSVEDVPARYEKRLHTHL